MIPSRYSRFVDSSSARVRGGTPYQNDIHLYLPLYYAAGIAAHMDEIFYQQYIVLLAIIYVMGLIAVSAQACLDFKRGNTDVRVTDKKMEASFHASHIGGGFHRSKCYV